MPHRISLLAKSLLALAVSLDLFALADDVSAESPTPPNVLFIISDDLNNSLGCYGHPIVHSPNIDRLAARGVRFERAYCQFPLCGPSRNSMLTGLHPNSTGIHANRLIFRETIPDHPSLSQAFRLQGYFAGRIGKLYHYDVPRSVGTNGHDDPGSWELELNPAGCDRLIEEPDIFSLRPGNFGGTLSWYASPRPEELHTDAMLAENAQWVLERCAEKRDRPFFLAVGFFRPHTPYVAPEEYFESYRLDEMPIVKDWEQDQKDIPKLGLGSHKKEHDLLDDDLRRQAIQAYYASITFMDAQVGKLLDTLDRLNLRDNTIIVFTSDHGYHLGEHGLWQKQSLFEESARVPLIIVAPGVSKKGTVAETPVGLIDLFPTLTSLCGIPAPNNLQGQDLTPILASPDAPGRGWAISQVRRGRRGKPVFGYAIRTLRWRYISWGESGKAGEELYDHQNDPRELTNLAASDENAATLGELKELLNKAIAQTFPESGEVPERRSTNWSPELEPRPKPIAVKVGPN